MTFKALTVHMPMMTALEIVRRFNASPLPTGMYCTKNNPPTYELREDGQPTGHEIVLHKDGTWMRWSEVPINIEEAP